MGFVNVESGPAGPHGGGLRTFKPRQRRERRTVRVRQGSEPGALDKLLRKRSGQGASARDIVTIARAAVASGAQSTLPHDIENASRNILQEGRRNLGVRWELWSEKTVVNKGRDVSTEGVDRHVLLPHEFMSTLFHWNRARFDEIMGIGACADFWRHVSAHNPEWFTKHPAHDDIMKEPDLHIPVRLFADDGGLGKTRKLNVVHWTSIVTRARATGECKIPLMVQADATAIKDITDVPLHSVIAWGFKCALSGYHPLRGPDGNPFRGPADKQRRKRAGRPIAGGFKLVYVMFVSDWKGEVETFHLEHNYNKTGEQSEMCHLCKATVTGEHSYCNPCSNNPCFDHPRSNDDYMASASYMQSPLSHIPGFHILQVLPDAMHVGPLGIFLTVAGSVLWELCESEACFGPINQPGKWQDSMAIRLKLAYAEFWRFVQRKGKSCTQRIFKVSHLTMSKKDSKPELKAKAANAMVVVEWLAEYCRQQADLEPARGNQYIRDRADMLWSLTSIYSIWRQSGMWLTMEAREALHQPRNAFFPLYIKLRLRALDDDKPLYNVAPKHHMLDHMVRHCLETGLNPASYWCFQDEDAMRVAMKMAEHSKQGTVDTFCLNRWCLQFFATSSCAEARTDRGWKRPLLPSES